MRKIAVIAVRADRFCARLNDGLLAVAIVLAILTLAVSTIRAMEAYAAIDAEWPMAGTAEGPMAQMQDEDSR